jgi:hypothetical protein
MYKKWDKKVHNSLKERFNVINERKKETNKQNSARVGIETATFWLTC